MKHQNAIQDTTANESYKAEVANALTEIIREYDNEAATEPLEELQLESREMVSDEFGMLVTIEYLIGIIEDLQRRVE